MFPAMTSSARVVLLAIAIALTAHPAQEVGYDASGSATKAVASARPSDNGTTDDAHWG